MSRTLAAHKHRSPLRDSRVHEVGLELSHQCEVPRMHIYEDAVGQARTSVVLTVVDRTKRNLLPTSLDIYRAMGWGGVEKRARSLDKRFQRTQRSARKAGIIIEPAYYYAEGFYRYRATLHTPPPRTGVWTDHTEVLLRYIHMLEYDSTLTAADLSRVSGRSLDEVYQDLETLNLCGCGPLPHELLYCHFNRKGQIKLEGPHVWRR